VPVEVPARRARTLAVRWLVEFARQRREKTMAQRLANELLDAQQQQGGAYKRKDDIYRMAQANKAFAHYRVVGGTGRELGGLRRPRSAA
jgi:small subunit ribosomal protein S7